jgi:hypothetical protein
MIWRLATEPTRPLYILRGACGRGLMFEEYVASTATIRMNFSQPYPKLFSVNREARYEATKAPEAQWVPLKLGQSHTTTFELCINFKTDAIYVCARFADAMNYPVLRQLRMAPQQNQLDVLARILGDHALQQIKALILYPVKPAGEYYYEYDAWWNGEGLERIREGEDKEIALITPSGPKYGRWLFREILEYLEPSRLAMNPEKHIPRITVLASGHIWMSPAPSSSRIPRIVRY